MSIIVSRTCTEIREENGEQRQNAASQTLEAFRDVSAYVLLGDPGAGKTTAFEAECEALGENAYSRVITADEFLTYDVSDLPPEWREKTLFIDGLDEVRAGSQGESAFREIRKFLRALGKPRFRLSCRQADWLGTNDQERLESVSPDSKVTVLRLDPLTDSDVEKILNARSDIPDAHTFIKIAKEKGVDGLLANPLSLDMLAKAVASGRGWPESRKETFEMACREIVDGHHKGRKELLDAAGRLCAVQLISGAAGYTLHGQANEEYPALDQCDSGSLEMLHYARATKLFKGVSDNRFSPFHRHIAEFLGARHLAGVINSGLPARRVIALIMGKDGTVVTEMRGVSAWLAAHCKDARTDLIERDPIGVGLYGDIREFSTDEKRALLKSLNREGLRLGSVLLKTAPFGGLAKPGMEPVLREILEDSKRDKDHQTFTRFVLEILGEGSTLPGLSDVLLKMVRDDTWWPDINVSALLAFIDTYPEGQDKTSKLEALLADIDAGNVSGPNNQFLKNLLTQQLEPAVSDDTCQSGNEGLSLEVQQEHARDEDRVKAILERMRPSWATPLEPLAKEQEEWLDRIRSNEAALRENRAAPGLLHQVAEKYFGFLFSEDDGPKAIEESLRGDRNLTNASLEGLRGTVDREDVPEGAEILGLRARDQMHYLGLPFLAGLAEIERTVPEEDASQWSDSRIRRALAFYHCTPHPDYQPQWYRQLLAARPKIVAEVQVPFVTSELHSRREVIYKLKELAHDPDHASLARYASLPLLKSFPTRCNLSQIEHLDYLLWAATQHADRASLQELIKSKLSRKSMNDAQRVHWLAAGVIIAPRTYNDRLRDFLQGREGRIRHLVTFFENRGQVSFDKSRIALLEFLISLLGSYIGPRQRLRGEGDETTMQGFSLVHQLIHNLAASPTKDASDALDRLLADPALSRWHDVLSQALDAQRVTWRDASYSHPTIEQICQTLNDGEPANAADLAALLMDRFDEIADRISTNNANYWRPYWNEDKNQNPTNPKHENSCRDALLRDLRLYFPNAEPEVQNIGNTRTDICVAYPDFQVPVEIKKNSHQRLWSSLRNQLIAQYTIDPNTDGYGIYLVFWFGKDRTPPPPSGTRPANPKQLQERLVATLSPDEARKISVCVIDVSRPD